MQRRAHGVLERVADLRTRFREKEHHVVEEMPVTGSKDLTVSPVTAALCVSDPFPPCAPLSIYLGENGSAQQRIALQDDV